MEYPPWILLVLAALFAVIAVALLWIIARSRMDAGRFAFNVSRPLAKGSVPMLELACTNEEKIKVTVAPVTSTGKPSQIQPGSLVVEIQEGEGTVVQIDETSFFVVSQDVLDETPMTMYRVKADADLGEGVTELVDFVQLTVGPAQAVSLGLSAGAAEPK